MAGKADPVTIGRQYINGRMYPALVLARALFFLPCFVNAFTYARAAYICSQGQTPLAYCAPETLLPALWSLVSAYMSYCAADGLMVRWIVTYSKTAALIRMIAGLLANFLYVNIATRFADHNNDVGLLIWVFNSCFLTFLYILQSFVVSNMGNKRHERTLNLLRITVFAVIPIGLASFLTMLGLVRTVMLLQIHFKAFRDAASAVGAAAEVFPQSF